MTDKPQNRLSLKPKTSKAGSRETVTPPATQRSKKRIVWRYELPASKLAKTKAPTPKAKKKPKSAVPKVPGTPPSDIRLDNLNASLNAFEVQLLAVGIEKQVFQYIAEHQRSASKRVVQRLLRGHTRDQRYLQAIQMSGVRFNLDGSEAGSIAEVEKEHASRILRLTGSA